VGWALYSTNQMNELLLGAATIQVKTGGVAVSIQAGMLLVPVQYSFPVIMEAWNGRIRPTGDG
jgi:hypothetical protein